jgi:hypothetical protein
MRSPILQVFLKRVFLICKDMAEKKTPLNIWKNIERTYGIQLNISFEGNSIVAIHNSDFEDVVNDIDKLCKQLQKYRSEMIYIYGKKPKSKSSNIYTKIYLIKDDKTGFHKIGRSANPRARERTLQAEVPSYKLIWQSDFVDIELEKTIHNKFASKRIRGEWFNLTKDDIKYIKDLVYVS